MEAKTRVKLIDELMTVVEIMDELYRYHPDNPNRFNVAEEYKILAERKAQIEAELLFRLIYHPTRRGCSKRNF